MLTNNDDYSLSLPFEWCGGEMDRSRNVLRRRRLKKHEKLTNDFEMIRES